MNLKIALSALSLFASKIKGDLNQQIHEVSVGRQEENLSRNLSENPPGYELVGPGYCSDKDDQEYRYHVVWFEGKKDAHYCADVCDDYGNKELKCKPYCLGFIYTLYGCCILQLTDDKEIEGKCPITKSTDEDDMFHTCYKRNAVSHCPDCDGGVNADPLFIGLRGQIFKFEGRDEAWYANIATKQLQWNLQFGKFSACPKDNDMFVTGTSMLFFDNTVFTKGKPAHTIVIKVASKNEYSPGCSAGEEVCLAYGSLHIMIDGKRITAPGDYTFSNNYGRVIAHNTFGSCSRKWYDYREKEEEADDLDERILRMRKRPIEYLVEDKETMLNPNDCNDWLDKRIKNNDLFAQKGDWVTVHVGTPLISFHVEYRKNKFEGGCMSHSIDAWITKVSPELKEHKWQGILGETAESKFDSFENEVLYGRENLLSAKDDEAYEVDGEFGTEFAAREKYQWW